MTILLHHESHRPHHLTAMEAFRDGLAVHGIKSTIRAEWLPPQLPAPFPDLVVVWSSNMLKEAKVAVPDTKYLVLEAGYLNGDSGDYVTDRLKYISASWGALHGNGQPPPKPCPSDRWDRLDVELEPWREGELEDQREAVVCAQMPGDPMGKGADFGAIWEEAAVARPARIRQHPLWAQRTGAPTPPPLLDDLLDCGLCITWNSSAAVQTVIAGIPTVALDRASIAWNVTSHKITDEPYTGDREAWAHQLAYRQWTLAEYRSGEAWEHLKYGLEAPVGSKARGGKPAGRRADIDGGDQGPSDS